jgi:hypothetical protein
MAKVKTKVFHSGNEEAARIILADPKRYAGLPLEWAKLWRERHPGIRIENEPKPEAGHLFAA